MRSIKVLASIMLGVVVSAMLFGGSKAFAAETPYSIIYDSGVVTDMPTDEDSKTLSDTVQISSSKPKRNGLSFYGWCNTIPTNVDGNDTCSGTTFAIGSDWSINPTTVNNNLRLYAMWGEERPEPQPSTAGCINYFANASDAVGTMGCQSQDYRNDSYYDIADGDPVTLLASNFSRTGYGFAGWSDSYDYATNPNAKFYGPQETITVPEGTTTNGFSLYAVWIKSQGSIQDQSKVASVCNSLTTAPTNGTANLNSVSALTDSRDNNTYAIAKLADGKCWMIENLRLDNTAELTTLNTNNPLNDGTNVTLKHNYTDTTTSNTLSATSSVAYNADTAPDGWCTNPNAACYDQSRLRTDNTANRATNNPNTNSGSMYSYGNYYNWYSVTAGRGTYSKSSGEVEGDLCPSGWKLPLGNTSTGDISQSASDTANKVGGFSYLDRKMGGTGQFQPTSADSVRWRKFPVNTLYSGYVGGGSLDGRGAGGYYWSSTASSSNGAYDLYLYSSNVDPGTGSGKKYNGRAVRCVASI